MPAPRVLKAGDLGVLILGAVLVISLAWRCWGGGPGERVIVRSGGAIVAELPLSRDTVLRVAGPLGVSAIQIQHGRARVASDPGARQYCVHQGWLEHAGELAACLPNQVSVEVAGAARLYDSLSY